MGVGQSREKVGTVLRILFSEYDGCYHREGRVVPVGEARRGCRVPVIARRTDARAYYQLYGHEVAFTSSPARLAAVRRHWAAFDGPSVRFVGANRVDLGMRARVGVAIGVAQAACVSDTIRRLGWLITVNEEARAPIVRKADVALVGPEERIINDLAAGWAEVMEQVALAKRVQSTV